MKKLLIDKIICNNILQKYKLQGYYKRKYLSSELNYGGIHNENS